MPADPEMPELAVSRTTTPEIPQTVLQDLLIQERRVAQPLLAERRRLAENAQRRPPDCKGR